MSVKIKQYGIYLCYAPTVNLCSEGLGRYLAAFLKGASARNDVQFVLVCPSWSREGLLKLFDSEGVAPERFTIVSPHNKPWLLRCYEAYLARKKKPKSESWSKKIYCKVRAASALLRRTLENHLVRVHNIKDLFQLIPIVVIALVGILLTAPILLIGAISLALATLSRKKATNANGFLRSKFNRLSKIFSAPKDDNLVLRLYLAMQASEAERMLRMIAGLQNISAWYCPTAFWPEFNQIDAPKLMCVPDVVLSDFPIGFSQIGGNRFLSTFEAAQSAIRNGEHFITYSETIKWGTLVDRYAIDPSRVAVSWHAPNDLHHWVEVKGFANTEATSLHYCRTLLSGAMRKASNFDYTRSFSNGEVAFLFYASQFRPNKNVLTLLKAYEFLLRTYKISHKLILTGDPSVLPSIRTFIEKHHLENDILCLHGLSVQELAACYKLADLAVNPSLSEGGCPFTFTEALSVDTPAVMARISVTEEVLTDPELQEMTFFDPYDWKDIAHRIEWALHHRDILLQVQRKTYFELSKRTWTDVVNEHISVLDKISEPHKALSKANTA